MDEAEWMEMMRGVVQQCRRVLTDNGSAVFILQPNQSHVGTVRTWLWDFMAWTSREWNMVQDVYWHNPSPFPTVHCQRKYGLMRQSIKVCVWLGPPTCYRDQDAILLPIAEATLNDKRVNNNNLKYSPQGGSMRYARGLATCKERGGSTPINLLTISNSQPHHEGCKGHGASTPLKLCEWWVKYITKNEDTVLDPFSGSGSVGVAALNLGRKYIGIDSCVEYTEIAENRLSLTLLSLTGAHPK